MRRKETQREENEEKGNTKRITVEKGNTKRRNGKK